MKSDLL